MSLKLLLSLPAFLSWCSFVVYSQDTDLFVVEVSLNDGDECINPCPWRYDGFVSVPGKNCKSYAQCKNGNPIGEFECFGQYIFVESKGGCDFENNSCQPVSCPVPPTPSPTNAPTISVKPVSDSPTVLELPTRPTPFPTPVFFSFRNLIESRAALIENTVLQTESGPSTAYTIDGLMSALDVVVNQLPSDKTFYVGDSDRGLIGLEYGAVNFAAFFSQAMSEGIRMDSCDEWNTDYIFQDNTEKFPLSNACGQYNRAYDSEVCQSNEPFECPIDMNMEVTAVDRNEIFLSGKTGPPAFSCKPRDGESFPGFYDQFDDEVFERAYSNSLGRTDLAGCCWWKRGALMTGGRCALGKLNKFVGKDAADSRGIFVYPDIDFCSAPESICEHARTNELRWLIGLLDWSGRVEAYVDSNTGWSYMKELKRFVDNGMVGNDFIDAVSNIVTLNCHNLAFCADPWRIDEEKEYFEQKRRQDFRTVIKDVFNLPLTAAPTPRPNTISPTFKPTISVPPTRRPARPTLLVLSPNHSTPKCKCNTIPFISMVALLMWYLLL